jgi:uncharacterized SAM-binding protein YcdF (DUF218 family)
VRFSSYPALLALGGVSAATALTYARIRSDGRQEGARAADAVLLFGASVSPSGPSLAVRTRTRRAADLHGAGYAPLLICSGTAAETGWMQSHLIEVGVPNAAIAIERADSTRETIAAAFERLGSSSAAIAVTSHYHMHRVLCEARRVGLTLLACPTGPVKTSPKPMCSWVRTQRNIAREIAAVWVYRLTTPSGPQLRARSS